MPKETAISLTEIAKQAMLDRDLLPDFPPEAIQQAAEIPKAGVCSHYQGFRDLSDKLWISIDNVESLDLDQLTYLEVAEGKKVIYIAVADVDGLVEKDSPIDLYAKHNTTSIYTPTIIFPMLPLKLSNNLTSLNPDEQRCAIVTEIEVSEDGLFSTRGIYPALVQNRAKLAYTSVGAHLEGTGALPDPFNKNKEVIFQIESQNIIAEKLEQKRQEMGTLNFASTEMKPILQQGAVVDLQPLIRNKADRLIENFMIAANISVTRFLAKKDVPTIRRVVKVPKNWSRIVELAKVLGTTLPHSPDAKALQLFLEEQKANDPDRFPDLSLSIIKLIGRGEYVANFPGEKAPGHFDLAVVDYSHTTAPNRRYPDLIMQRLLKAHFFKAKSPYSKSELTELAARCTQKEDDATKVERRVRKSAAAIILSTQIGHVFSGFITGASEKGTWVRIKHPPVEGKVVRGGKGLEVGDAVKVKLINVDIENGFIDFATT